MPQRDDTTGSEDRAEVVRRELLLLDPAIRGNRRMVRALLHPDFVEFGASGRLWDFESIVKSLTAELAPVRREAVDLVPVSLSGDIVLLTYRIVDDDQTTRASWSTAAGTLRSSVWLRHTNGEWRVRFHQATPALGKPRDGAPVSSQT